METVMDNKDIDDLGVSILHVDDGGLAIRLDEPSVTFLLAMYEAAKEGDEDMMPAIFAHNITETLLSVYKKTAN